MSGNSEEESNHNQAAERNSDNRKYQIIEPYSGGACSDNCQLDAFNRVRYFTGQLLVPEDLLEEQSYLNDKRHLINRMVNGTGIVCGLSTQILDQNSRYLRTQISSGFAVDCCGREIIVKNDISESLEIEDLFDETTKRIGLFLTREDVPNSPVPNYLTNSSEGRRISESRIKESSKLTLRIIEQSPVKIEFDRTSYCIDDKVRVELWDPDETLARSGGKKESRQQSGVGKGRENGERVDKIESDGENVKVKVNISSNKDMKGIEVLLSKSTNMQGVYREELTLTRSGESGKNMLQVFDNDNIKAKINDGIYAYAYVNSSKYSFLIDQRKLMNNYYEKKLLHCNEKGNGIHDPKSHEHGVLLAILKTKPSQQDQGVQSLYIDQDETAMLRKVVYNNALLYDFAKENRTCYEEDKKLTKTAILSDIYEVDIEKLKPYCYIITHPIKIFDESNPMYINKLLEFPPLIYLGRTSYDSTDKVMYFEDFDYDLVVNDKKYQPNTLQDTELTKDTNLSLMQSITFKPVDITINTFRLMIAREYETEEHTEKLVLRWWALCNFKEQ